MRVADRLVELGMGPEAALAKARLHERACAALGVSPGVGSAALALFVPGRIEVLGKHTDYAGGRSLLCAAERGILLVARPRTDDRVVVHDVVCCERAEASLDGRDIAAGSGWEVYVRTAAHRLARNFPSCRGGADIAFGSDLPLAAGMSSSSALLTSIVLALVELNELADTALFREAVHTPEDLAEYLGTIENGQDFRTLGGDRGVGTFGGSEDHTAMLCCRPGELSQYLFCPVRHERQLPMPPGHWFVIAVSGVVAEKTAAARERYNRVSLAAHEVLDIWNAATGRLEPTLGAAVRKFGPDGFAQVTPPALVERFDQFYDETFEIIPRVGDALLAGRIDEVGELVDRSQRGAERGLGNQVPETVFLAHAARRLGAAAASAFGAGFGGSVWALVESANAPAFTNHWAAAYHAAFPQHAARARFFTSNAGPPATRL